jgi:hypothetical protein
MVGWMDGWMDGRMDGWMDGWMGGWVGGWVGGWLDGWVDGWSSLICTLLDETARNSKEGRAEWPISCTERAERGSSRSLN